MAGKSPKYMELSQRENPEEQKQALHGGDLPAGPCLITKYSKLPIGPVFIWSHNLWLWIGDMYIYIGNIHELYCYIFDILVSI